MFETFNIKHKKIFYFQSLVIKNINNFIIHLIILYMTDKYNFVDYILLHITH